MGLGRKVGAFLGLVPEDQEKYGDAEYSDHYGYADDDHAEDRRDPRYDDHDFAERDARFDRGAGDSRYPDGGYDRNRPSARRGFDADAPQVHGALAVKPEPAPMLRPIESAASARPVTVKLTGFGEARVVGEKYRDGQPVILDMTEMADSDARRLVDFSAGLAFAMRGSIDKVAPKVFMLLPPDADVSAVAADYHAGHPGR